jgi:mRNA interferase MazF
VILAARTTRLPKDSVANVSQLVTLDRSTLQEHIVKLPPRRIEAILSGIDVVLGR